MGKTYGHSSWRIKSKNLTDVEERRTRLRRDVEMRTPALLYESAEEGGGDE